MKALLLYILFINVSVIAQITITQNDFSQIFAVGNGTTITENENGGAVNIGVPGGGNEWDFSWFQGSLKLEMLCINPATSPYINEFPDANVATYSVGDFEGDQAELWHYSSLNGSLGNHGSAVLLESLPGDLLTIKHVPARIEAELPLTINSSWSQSYTQTLYINGSPFITSQVSVNFIVDAYGLLTIPGGESFEALRIRESMTVNGSITSVTFQFITKSGAHAAVYATDPNPPNSGVIATEGFSWNSSFSSGGGSVFTFPPDYIMIAGEVDSIMYGNSLWNTELDLYYRTEEEGEFSLIESGYQSSDGKYYWDVPDSLLTTKANIKIVKTQDTTFQIISDQIKIKPWWLTRIDNSGDFELYELDQDGWSFTNSGTNMWPNAWSNQFNYQSGTDPFTNSSYPNSAPFNTAAGNSFPDWPLFVDVFSEPACYLETDNGLSYRNAATTRWGNIIRQWGGSCFGFTVTSLLGYYRHTTLEGMIGDFEELIDVGINNDSRYAINYFQIIQGAQEVLNYRLERTNDDARQLLANLKELFGQNNTDGNPLRYPNTNGAGGHAVVPYRLERADNSSNFNVWVYNPNNPNDFTQFIYIDSVANTWNDSTSLNWGSATTDCYLHNESAFFLDTLTLRPMLGFKSMNDENGRGSSRLTMLNSTEADIVITSGNGEQIGFQDSVAFNNMSDAIPIIPETGYFHPPTGYYLPENSYQVSMEKFTSQSSSILFQSETTLYSYFRNDAQPDENDLFGFSSDGIKIINPDNSAKDIELTTIILDENLNERVFTFNDIIFSSGDSLNIKQLAGSELLFNNYGQGNVYNLRVIDLSHDGEIIFEHNAVQIAQNSGHQIVPDWNDLQNEPVKILIDLGNDGTIDDSMFVKNQATNVEDEGSLLSPDNYNLAQNYPNPFNPTTTIKYSIPETGNVSLKVYDILGNEVASLVNEEKTQGVYSVTFDASRLSSGVYFYKIQAGSYTSTKKMLLLK